MFSAKAKGPVHVGGDRKVIVKVDFGNLLLR